MGGRTVANWLNSNPHAVEVVEVWLEERASGKTSWTIRRLMEDLQEHHGFPFRNHDSFGRCLSRLYGKRYHDAMNG